MATDPATCDVLLSFADDDTEFARGVVEDALTQAGIRVRHQEVFELGQSYLDELILAVRECRYVVVVLSPAYEVDRLRQFQTNVVQHLGLEDGRRRVIPVLYRPMTEPNPLLDVLVSLDCQDAQSWGSQMARLCKTLGKPLPPPTGPPPCPYPGIVPFDEEDAGVFFGRGEIIDEIVERMVRSDRLLLIGPSGSGKSSLIFAGVVPALSKTTLFNGQTWSTQRMRPGEKLLKELASALGSPVGAPTTSTSELLQATGKDRLLLVVDQLEEFFTRTQEEGKKEFVAGLTEVWEAPNCHVLGTKGGHRDYRAHRGQRGDPTSAARDFYQELMQPGSDPALPLQVPTTGSSSGARTEQC